MIEANVMWFSNEKQNGILTDVDGNEYYFDSSVIRSYPQYSLRHSFALISEARVGGTLCANNVFFLDEDDEKIYNKDSSKKNFNMDLFLNTVIQNSNNKSTTKKNPAKKNEETFYWGQYAWNVHEAKKLVSKKKIHHIKPSHSTMLPLVRIREEWLKDADLTKPVIFGTMVIGDEEVNALIDGHHRMTKAIKELKKNPKLKIPYIILNKKETDKISF